MARRKSGRTISGWCVVDKPAGLTSNAVVGRVRHAFNAKKAGHAGTLDPAATGVLAIALGEATKTVPYIMDAQKTYEFTVRFGAATNTDDAEGEVVGTSDLRPADAEIETALEPFLGDIQQIPPAFSAVKVDGERAYAKARSGEDVALEARPLHVAALELVARPDADHAVLSMTCGKGGYVRSVARDLGEALGCLGHVATLRRTKSGPFSAERATPLDEIVELAGTEVLDEILLPLEVALEDLPEARCTAIAADRLRHGNPGEITYTDAGYGDEAWASHQGQAIAVGTYRAGMLYPSRVFLQ